MNGKKSGLGILGAAILAMILIGTACKKPAEQPAKEKTPAAKTSKPAPVAEPAGGTTGQAAATSQATGDVVITVFYKAATPTSGKDTQMLELKVGEEITISVQGLDKDGRDIGACVASWKADSEIMKLTPVAGNCKATKVKALKAATATVLTAVFTGAKGNKIESNLKGAIK